MNKVIFKQQIIDAMMGFKSSFEKVLYSENYRLYWSGEEKLPEFTTNDASHHLEIFLKLYKEHHRDLIACKIIKINKNSIFVDKNFKMHSFINEIISLFDGIKCCANSISDEHEFMDSPFI